MDNAIVWTVGLFIKAKKKRRELPDKVRSTLAYLLHQMELEGPIQKGWANFDDLKGWKDISTVT